MTQNFENHVRFVPAFHFFILPLFGLNLLWSIYRLVRWFSVEAVVSLLLAAAFVVLAFYARIFALAVQDRVIRLEMMLRLERLVPDLQRRLIEFTVDQLIAMRFAADDELPDLARHVLAEKLTDRKTIKQMIRHWQADHLRA